MGTVRLDSVTTAFGIRCMWRWMSTTVPEFGVGWLVLEPAAVASRPSVSAHSCPPPTSTSWRLSSANAGLTMSARRSLRSLKKSPLKPAACVLTQPRTATSPTGPAAGPLSARIACPPTSRPSCPTRFCSWLMMGSSALPLAAMGGWNQTMPARFFQNPCLITFLRASQPCTLQASQRSCPWTCPWAPLSASATRGASPTSCTCNGRTRPSALRSRAPAHDAASVSRRTGAATT
mmetsp:Transcript_23069/g.53949  ORF Transcript_23069/g.53949 Transcript_23069/m.53949 type:complete len:234 (+) Transcript_23069:378-1079(+)